MATTFYHLSDTEEIKDSDPNAALLKRACALSAELYQQGLRVFVATSDVKTAEQLDELMWQLPSDQFIPHNLQGEGPH